MTAPAAGRHVVIGTAGHIDHGKTTLVRLLTGVDTDRLAEEKARGITIDLGFAPFALDGLDASIVDVPGHEGFIRNMVAGATGIDVALLVVAADEGVMPQTREHVLILRHLGVRYGVVALTKCDLATDASWRGLVADDVRSLLEEQLGAGWPVVEVAATGDGIPALRAVLRDSAGQVGSRAADDRFRLPVDRVFALPGAGTIVTGTAWSGRVQADDSVTVLPAGATARVRSIQVHGAASADAGAGQRTALALVGLAREQAGRGSTVVTGDGWRASRWVDVAASLVPDLELRVRGRFRLHHGTAEVMARIARIGEKRGDAVALRLALDEPIVARSGDRIVLRTPSPVATVGGGLIVDPWAERLPGQPRRPEPALPSGGDAEHVALLIARQGPAGLSRTELEVAAGFGRGRLANALRAAAALGIVHRDDWYVSESEVTVAAGRMLAALSDYHSAHPQEPGMAAQAWRAASRAWRPSLIVLAEERLTAAAAVVREGAIVRRPDWDPDSAGENRAAAERVLSVLRQADAEPPSLAELSAALPGLNVAATLRMLGRTNQVIPVSDRFYEAAALGRERDRLVEALRAGAGTPAEIRERLGRSRKWLIPLLEWADREGLTVRSGDRRMLRLEMGA